MMKNNDDMSIPRLIVKTLMSGDPLTTLQITDRVSDIAGRNIQVNNVAPTLSRLCNKHKCSLALFINKRRKGKSLVYQMADEAMSLSEDEAYGLTLKSGKNRFPLETATATYPDLMKYTNKKRGKSRRASRKKKFDKNDALTQSDAGVAWQPPVLKILSDPAIPKVSVDLKKAVQPHSATALNIDVTITVALRK